MTQPDLNKLADGWIARAVEGRKNPDSEKFFWAFCELDDLVRGEPETAWQVILLILAKDTSDIVFENLSAGPLETLLAQHGSAFIDRVEAEAAKNPAFASLLGGVWQNLMPQEIWTRLQAAWDREDWD